MNTIEEQGTKVVLDLKYFIQMAIQKKITWNTLAFFLIDLAPTLEKSKRVIETLVQELEKWISKVENNSKLDVTEMLNKNEKPHNIQNQEANRPDGESKENTEHFDYSDFEDESIIDGTEDLNSNYRMHASINRSYYYFFLNSHVSFSLMIGGILLKVCGYKMRAVIN